MLHLPRSDEVTRPTGRGDLRRLELDDEAPLC